MEIRFFIYKIFNTIKSLFIKKNTEATETIDSSEISNKTTIIETKNTKTMSTNYSNVTVLLDAGHAKSTPGKRSPYAASKTKPELSLYEYDFNRKLQNVIAKKLKAVGIGVEIITPEEDKDVALSTRAARANKIISENPGKHHLFISVHGNAAGNGTKWMNARGWSAYTTKGKTKSDDLAECLCNAAESILIPKGMKVREDLSDGDKDHEENFTVIYKTNCPAVLTENLFYDNVDDCKIMLSDEGKDLLAEVHLKGITDYINKFIK